MCYDLVIEYKITRFKSARLLPVRDWGSINFCTEKKYLLICPFFRIFVQLFVFMVHREPNKILKKFGLITLQYLKVLIGNNA